MASSSNAFAAEGDGVVVQSRAEKVKAIFEQFDKNDDGRLSKDEMASLVVAVNPSVRFSEEQIAAILDEVFRTYGAYIDSGGLSLDGLRQTYDDGAGDVDRDFDALGLTLAAIQQQQEQVALEKAAEKQAAINVVLPTVSSKAPPKPSGPTELTPAVKQLLEELEEKLQQGATGDLDAATLQKILADLRYRADTLPSRSPAESFEAHMEMGQMLGNYGRWQEALRSYRRAVALRPENARAHFRIGNAHFQLQSYVDARDLYERALQVARTPTDSKLLPQIHVNLGVALEYDGYLMGACEHYREAAILNPQHYRSLKHLGSALFALGELRAAEEALTHAVNLRPDYADAQVDLGNALYGLGNINGAVECFEKAVDLDNQHLEALYNLANVRREQNMFEGALKLYDRVLRAVEDEEVEPEWVWKVELNKVVCMIALGHGNETMTALQEVYKKTGKRVELYELKKILNNQQKNGTNVGLFNTMEHEGTSHTFGQPPQARAAGALSVKEAPSSRFARANRTTATPTQVKWALEIRAVQKVTKLGICTPVELLREASDSNLPDQRGSVAGGEGKIVRKANVEKIFRRLLDNFTTAQTFAQAMKFINQRMLAVLDQDENGTVDLGKVLAVVAMLSATTTDTRVHTAYDILLWRAKKKEDGQLPRAHARNFFRELRLVYKPSSVDAATIPAAVATSADPDLISRQEFAAMFESDDGFNYLPTFQRIEEFERVRHHGLKCAATGYNIVGPRFQCTNGNFSLCASSYAEQMVPDRGKNLEQYIFKEVCKEEMPTKLSKLACYSPRATVTMD